MANPRELELSEDAMRSLVDEATRRIFEHLASLPTQPANGAPEPRALEALARSVIEPLPEHGEDANELLDRLFELVPKSFNTAGPGYLAYIPGGGLFHAAVADLIADAVNRYVGVWAAAPALSQIETTVGRWLADMIGFPKAAHGLLTTGGSMANLVALVTARRNLLPDDFLSARIYASDQVHHSVTKAAVLAGFPRSACVAIPTDADFAMRLPALAAAIDADRREGRTPFCVVASAGTTNTGAIDPLDSIADVAARERLWMHVDAAYGGFFLLTDDGKRRMRGIERADSVTLDPHKAMFLPYGNGALVVRDRETLRRAHSVAAEYLPDMQGDPELVDPCEVSPELSRDFRGLRLWLPLKMHGASVFRAALKEKLSLARLAADGVRRLAHVTMVAEPQLSVLAFRLDLPGLDNAANDARTKDWLAKINGRQRVMLTPTTLRGRFVIRICVLSFRTHEDRIAMALEDIEATHREVVGSS
jgi:aromatic-L-amino-acid decarboxylase